MRKISIIIPCYNVASYVDRCIRSITVQSMGMEHLEIICIDDASTDDTWEHLKKWEQAFPENVLLIRQDVNRRQGAARNLGLQYASADWIAFVDADDWLEPDCFEQMYAPVGSYACDVVVCGIAADNSESMVYLKEEEKSCGNDRYILSDTPESKKKMLISKGLNVFAWAKIIRKRLLLEHQLFFPEGLVYEDNYWHPLLHIYADYIYVIGKKLYHYFMRASSTVHTVNTDHHLDRITIQMMKWEDYGRRGLLQEYHGELIFDFLWHAVAFMKTLVFRYAQPSFSHYQLQLEVICERIPDYTMDAFATVFSNFSDIDRVCFEALHHSLDQAGFQAFVKQIRQIV